MGRRSSTTVLSITWSAARDRTGSLPAWGTSDPSTDNVAWHSPSAVSLVRAIAWKPAPSIGFMEMKRVALVLAASWPMLPASVVLAASLVLVASADAAVDYTVVDLGTLGGSSSRGRSVNSTGGVAIASQITGNAATHAASYDPAAPGLHDLGTLGGTNSFGEAAGAGGRIVGYSDTANAGVQRA